MSTVRDTITRGLRKAGTLELTEEPEGPQEDAGLISYQGMLDFWLTNGTFGRFTDYLIDVDTEAAEWGRYTGSTEVTVTLPGSTTTHRLRPVTDGAMVILALGDPQEVWRYNGRSASWVAMHELTLDSTDPLAHLGLDGLAACLAMHIASDGRELNPATVAQAQAFRSALSQRPAAKRDPVRCRSGVLRPSRQAFARSRL